MQVLRFTDKDGRQFYNADMCPELVGETVRRLGYQCKVELLDIGEAEYFAIPATREAAELWRMTPEAYAAASFAQGDRQ